MSFMVGAPYETHHSLQKNTEIRPTSPSSHALKYLDLQRICAEGIVTMLLTIFYHPSLL